MIYKYNIFTVIKALYTKNLTNLDCKNTEGYHLIAILHWLSYDDDNIQVLEEVSKYFFYLNPELYLKLLYLCIGKKDQPPFLHKVEKEKTKENELYNKIRDTLQWSNRELKLYSKLLDKIIEPNKNYWKGQLGI